MLKKTLISTLMFTARAAIALPWLFAVTGSAAPTNLPAAQMRAVMVNSSNIISSPLTAADFARTNGFAFAADVAAVSGRVDTVESWGNHATNGYLTAETDPLAVLADGSRPLSGNLDAADNIISNLHLVGTALLRDDIGPPYSYNLTGGSNPFYQGVFVQNGNTFNGYPVYQYNDRYLFYTYTGVNGAHWFLFSSPSDNPNDYDYYGYNITGTFYSKSGGPSMTSTQIPTTTPSLQAESISGNGDGITNVVWATPLLSTNNTPTAFTPRYIGDRLIIHGATNLIYTAFGTSTNDWRQTYP